MTQGGSVDWVLVRQVSCALDGGKCVQIEWACTHGFSFVGI
jgi:hypothetical protein